MTVLTRPNHRAERCTELVLEVSDPLDISTLQQFWSDLRAAAARGPERLVVDLSQCPYLDAQAIRLLLDVHQLIWIQDGRLILRGAPPPVIRLLALAGVLNVFAVETALPEQVAR